MAAATDYLEMKLLQHLFGTTAFTRPTNISIGLFTVAPTVDAGTGGSEVVGNAYARQSISQLDASWTGLPTAGAGAIDNAAAITFPAATPAQWGTIVAVGVWDAASAGNLLMWGTVTPNKTVGINDVISFAIGALDITLD